jgi:cupin superfamily acireductone dioxygenase involved in methionine salvage
VNKETWSNARDEFTKEGLVPHVWSNEPGHFYEEHIHPYHKVLICLKGSIVFHTPDGDVALQEGDRLDLPPDTHHSATVGDSGVTCMEAAR